MQLTKCIVIEEEIEINPSIHQLQNEKDKVILQLEKQVERLQQFLASNVSVFNAHN